MNSLPTVVRPVRATLILISALAAMFMAMAPFIDFADPFVFVIAGAGYSILLSVVVVGLVLAAKRRVYWWWLISGLIPLGGVAATALWFNPSPENIFSDPFFIWLRAVQIVGFAWVGFGCCVGATGWTNFVRRHRLDNSAHK